MKVLNNIKTIIERGGILRKRFRMDIEEVIRMKNFVLFMIFFISLFTLTAVTMHEEIHAVNCERFGGVVIERGFNYVKCRIVNNDFHNFIDMLNEIVIFIAVIMLFLVMMFMTYINICIVDD